MASEDDEEESRYRVVRAVKAVPDVRFVSSDEESDDSIAVIQDVSLEPPRKRRMVGATKEDAESDHELGHGPPPSKRPKISRSNSKRDYWAGKAGAEST